MDVRFGVVSLPPARLVWQSEKGMKRVRAPMRIRFMWFGAPSGRHIHKAVSTYSTPTGKGESDGGHATDRRLRFGIKRINRGQGFSQGQARPSAGHIRRGWHGRCAFVEYTASTRCEVFLPRRRAIRPVPRLFEKRPNGRGAIGARSPGAALSGCAGSPARAIGIGAALEPDSRAQAACAAPFA